MLSTRPRIRDVVGNSASTRPCNSEAARRTASFVGRLEPGIDGFQSKLPSPGPGGLLTFRGMYLPAYRTLSAAVHGQKDVMAAYIGDGARLWPVGSAASDRSLWFPMSVVLYAQALLVCHEVLGAPDDARVREINNRMYGV